jgi:hypothetical protein
MACRPGRRPRSDACAPWFAPRFLRWRRGRATACRRSGTGGRPLLGFRAAQRHLSIFPFSPGAIGAVEDRLGGFDVAKGTIRFTPDSPVPDDVLTDLVRARAREIDGS